MGFLQSFEMKKYCKSKPNIDNLNKRLKLVPADAMLNFLLLDNLRITDKRCVNWTM